MSDCTDTFNIDPIKPVDQTPLIPPTIDGIQVVTGTPPNDSTEVSIGNINLDPIDIPPLGDVTVPPFDLKDAVKSPNAASFADLIQCDIDKHLNKQFEEGRINGNDFGEIYSQLLQFSIQAGLDWATKSRLTHVQILDTKMGMEIKKATFSMEGQKYVLDAKLSVLKFKLELAKTNATIRKNNVDIKLAYKQLEISVAKANADIAQTNSQIALNYSKINLEKVSMNLDIAKTNIQLKLSTEELKFKRLQTHIEQRKLTLAETTAANEIRLKDAELLLRQHEINTKLELAKKEFELKKALGEKELEIKEQELKQAEYNKYLLRAKAIVEIAQISDLVPDFFDVKGGEVVPIPFANKVPVAGIQKQQLELVRAQQEGFKKKTKQDFARMLLDFYTARLTTEGSLNLSLTGLNEPTLGRILKKTAANQEFTAADIDINASANPDPSAGP